MTDFCYRCKSRRSEFPEQEHIGWNHDEDEDEVCCGKYDDKEQAVDVYVCVVGEVEYEYGCCTEDETDHPCCCEEEFGSVVVPVNVVLDVQDNFHQFVDCDVEYTGIINTDHTRHVE